LQVNNNDEQDIHHPENLARIIYFFVEHKEALVLQTYNIYMSHLSFNEL